MTDDFEYEYDNARVVDIDMDDSPQKPAPWFVDLFKYPFNLYGIMTISIFVILPCLFDLFLAVFMIVIPRSIMGILATMIYAFMRPFWFLIWLVWIFYLARCVRHSADGNTRAPDMMGNEMPDPSEVISTFFTILVLSGLFIAPFIYFFIKAISARHGAPIDLGPVFLPYTAAATIFAPATILSVLMHDTITGINPFKTIPAIIKTFPWYLMLILRLAVFLAAIIFISFLIGSLSSDSQISLFVPILGLFTKFTNAVLSMIVAHSLGSFFCKHEHKIAWEV